MYSKSAKRVSCNICHLSLYKSVHLSLVYFLLAIKAVTSQSQDIPNQKPGIYALPEISLKLGNGTMLEVSPNSPVKLSQEVGFVQMTCIADYPVKWEFLVNNKTIPVLDVVYRRLVRNISDFDNPKKNRFMSMITLRGLLQSQTGKYLCRLYNEKLNNNSYAVASYFDIFIPGNRTFNAISTVSFVNKTAAYVNIHCPVTDPDLHVRLYKLNDQHFNKSRVVAWRSIYANYEPTDGFKLLAGLGRELVGVYNCTADNGASLISVVADPSEREHYQSLSPSLSISINSSCRENYKLVQYFRSRRLECYCQDSFGLFMNDNFNFENRQANCSSIGLALLLNKISDCSDWRLDEFIKNQEESSNACFRGEKEAKPDSHTIDDEIYGTGSRPSIKVRGKTFPNGDDHRNFPFTNLSITYNGFVDWAGDFMLAVCRKELCVSENNDGRDNKTGTDLEYLGNDPTTRQYFPMAHYQAVWNDLFVNGTNIRSVYVLQAHSLSYAWFPYATAKIEWEKENSSVELDMDRSPFDKTHMMSVTSSCSTFSIFKITSYIFYIPLIVHFILCMSMTHFYA